MKAFTLIEVIVSVLILFIATSAFFSLTQNSMHLYDIFESKKEFELRATIPLTEEKGGNLKEILLNFKIENDKILKSLNNEIFYDEEIDTKKEFNGTNVTIYKLKARDKHNRLEIYSIGIK